MRLGRRLPLPALLLTLCSCSNAVYWGEGWEDPVAKTMIGKALKVVSNDSSVPNEDLTDSFDWLTYEQLDGGSGRVSGSEGYTPQPLQSWVPRNDTVQHGYFMLFKMDNNVSTLDRPMEELFFSISIDVGVHPEYEANQVERVNCTLRLMLFEGLPVDLGSNSEAQMGLMRTSHIVYSSTLTSDLESHDFQ